eukprot:CAMPEP_0204346832 /NCGR_PEP_ID=MMETSP0469-20131031/27474_1 /ASSEMBLY_ACC=CAM_ASM_000384 /TAXON_ID=2969 /ORGANISM="Oxyrrhis marina" /LENGTH=131 /DNA_ID=CAMNT_0051332515 /DNA_START=26 /DNA_END=418 /DNA_ORIENTATION=+
MLSRAVVVKNTFFDVPPSPVKMFRKSHSMPLAQLEEDSTDAFEWMVKEAVVEEDCAGSIFSPRSTCDDGPSGAESLQSPEFSEEASEDVDTSKLPISVWRRMCLPELLCADRGVPRRWARLMGKLLAREMD